MVLEDAQDFEQQIAKVCGVHGFKARLIVGIKLQPQTIGKTETFALGHVFGC